MTGDVGSGDRAWADDATARPAQAVTVRAPAKINLTLAVGPRRPDGYHELATVFHAVSLYDEIVAAPADEVTVTVDGPLAPVVPTDGSNLAVRAANLLAAHTGAASGVRLQLHKRIPVAGGMAGGSADAAAALVACDALWGTGLSNSELSELAALLGSDVPFALLGGTAAATGRGERISQLPAAPVLQWVIAVADGELSTPEVYAELDRMRGTQHIPPPEVPATFTAALGDGDLERLGSSLRNDLQEPAIALRPSLRRTLDAGLEAGALGGLVSGSGPTCVFLVGDPEQAATVSERLAASRTCREVAVTSGPVPGARVVT